MESNSHSPGNMQQDAQLENFSPSTSDIVEQIPTIELPVLRDALQDKIADQLTYKLPVSQQNSSVDIAFQATVSLPTTLPPVSPDTSDQFVNPMMTKKTTRPLSPTGGLVSYQSTSLLPEAPHTSINRNAEPHSSAIMQKDNSNFQHAAPTPPATPIKISRGKALLFIALLCILVIQALSIGPTGFLGSRGWAYILSGTSSQQDLLAGLQETNDDPEATQIVQLTPEQYVDRIISRMTLDQKLGQLMMVQFTGASYSETLKTMIDQYHIGSILLFTANGNIVDANQLTNLTQDIQTQHASLPLAIAIDQEGGYVDRLLPLNGASPSAASIGATGNPKTAEEAGLKDAQMLTEYGINLNLAPVVDIDQLATSELHIHERTFGGDADTVIDMANAYIDGLQESGKVLATLKHFPGLGNVDVDPHFGLPVLTQSKETLNSIDWAPYRSLIQQTDVHAIMVTHALVPVLDNEKPASLSPAIIHDILRKEFGFNGVIMTDSLTMDGISANYTIGEAAALAIAAGSDIIMGANSIQNLVEMLDGIKHAIQNGTITEEQINQSTRRVLLMKYAMGLFDTSNTINETGEK